MAYEFKNKTILVTGAGGYIGREISVNLAKLGAKVFALDKSQEKLDDIIREYPGVYPVCQDLGNWDETKNIVQELGELDGLVNNAVLAFNLQKAVAVPKEHLNACLDVNLLGPVKLMQVVGKKMAASGRGGSIVNISSQLSSLAMGDMLAYSLSKAGLNMATKMFALKLGPDNIRVNTVIPGPVSNDLLRLVRTGEGIQVLVKNSPLGHLAQHQDVTGLVLFLLSDRSTMINHGRIQRGRGGRGSGPP